MQRSIAVGLGWLLLGGCGRLVAKEEPAGPAPTEGTPNPDTATAPSGDQPRRYAVVRSGGRMYLAANGDDGLEIPPLEGRHVQRPLGVTVEVVGEENGRLAVETLGRTETLPCSGALAGLAAFRLKFFVAREDLLRVTTTRVQHRFSDGSSIALAAGVPFDRDAPQPEAVTQGARIRVPIPDDLLGETFVPAGMFVPGDDLGTIALGRREGPLRYDGDRVLDEVALFWSTDGPLYFDTQIVDEAIAVVTTRGPCVELTTRMSRARLIPRKPSISSQPTRIVWSFDPEAMPNPGIMGYVEQPGVVRPSESEVAPGTVVQWSDGRAAGVVREPYVFTSAAETSGNRSCFRTRVSDRSKSAVTLCFASGDVTEEPVGDAFGVAGFETSRDR